MYHSLKVRFLPLFLFLLLLTGSWHIASATHFRYGVVTWEQRPDLGPNTAEFTVTAAFRRSGRAGSGPFTGPGGRPGVGDIITEFQGGTGFSFGDGSSTGRLRFRIIAIDVANDVMVGRALQPGTSQENLIYTYRSQTNGGSPWIAEVFDCCRLTSLENSPNGNYKVQTEVRFDLNNQSPSSTINSIVNVPVNSIFNFNIPATDDDGDDLSYRFSTSFESSLSDPIGPAGGSDAPNTPTINSATGQVTWNTAGTNLDELYAMQVTVVESRNGVPIGRIAVDFVIQMVEQGTNNPPSIALNPTGPFEVIVGEPLSFTVTGTDPDAGDVITLNTAGLPPGATATPTLPTNGPTGTSFTINWTPTASQVGNYPINFTVTDQGNLQQIANATIEVKPVPVCNVEAGGLSADATPVQVMGGSVTISATPDGNQVEPAGYTTAYVLTSSPGLIIEALGSTPSFTVSTPGKYTIHTLIYNDDPSDPEYLDLSGVVLGTTPATDVVNLINDQNLCADLDVTGATIEVTPAGPDAPTNLIVYTDTAFLAPLHWDDNSNDEDGFVIRRYSSRGMEILDTVPADQNFFYDWPVDIFGENILYDVYAYNANGDSDPTNQDNYSMPANFMPLELTFVCYDPATDSITWNVHNHNNQFFPFIWATWWTPQRDTIWAFGNHGDTRFMTENNTTGSEPFGDPNITGVWYWIENFVTEKDEVFSADLSVNCSALRRKFVPLGGQAHLPPGLEMKVEIGSSMDDLLSQLIKTSPNPFSDRLMVEAADIDQAVNMALVNAYGQTVWQGSKTLTQGVEINLESLPAGVYFLNVRAGEAQMTRKLMKQ